MESGELVYVSKMKGGDSHEEIFIDACKLLTLFYGYPFSDLPL